MYCEPEEVRNVLYPGTGATPQSGAADLSSDYLLTFIARAERKVNARLGVRYPVPFSDDRVPVVVHDITRDLAAFYTDQAQRGQLDYTSQLEPILVLRQDAETLLDQLSTGKADLGLAPPDDGSGGEAEGRGAGRPRNVYPGRLFNPSPYPVATPVVDPWAGPGAWF